MYNQSSGRTTIDVESAVMAMDKQRYENEKQKYEREIEEILAKFDKDSEVKKPTDKPSVPLRGFRPPTPPVTRRPSITTRTGSV